MRLHLAIPSAPQNVQVIFVNQSALEIQWQRPAVTGDQTNIFYEVECRRPCEREDESECVDKACGSDVIFKPRRDGVNITHITVGNLTSFVNYTIKVYGRNRVSSVAKMKHGIQANFAAITIRTNGSRKSVCKLLPDCSFFKNKSLVELYILRLFSCNFCKELSQNQ